MQRLGRVGVAGDSVNTAATFKGEPPAGTPMQFILMAVWAIACARMTHYRTDGVATNRAARELENKPTSGTVAPRTIRQADGATDMSDDETREITVEVDEWAAEELKTVASRYNVEREELLRRSCRMLLEQSRRTG